MPFLAAFASVLWTWLVRFVVWFFSGSFFSNLIITTLAFLFSGAAFNYTTHLKVRGSTIPEYIAQLPPSFHYFASYFELGFFLKMVIGAYLARFLMSAANNFFTRQRWGAAK